MNIRFSLSTDVYLALKQAAKADYRGLAQEVRSLLRRFGKDIKRTAPGGGCSLLPKTNDVEVSLTGEELKTWKRLLGRGGPGAIIRVLLNERNPGNKPVK